MSEPKKKIVTAVILSPGENEEGIYSEEAVRDCFEQTDSSQMDLPEGATLESSYITEEHMTIGMEGVPKGSWVITMSIDEALLEKFSSVSWRFKPPTKEREMMTPKTIREMVGGVPAWLCVGCGVLTIIPDLVDKPCTCGAHWWCAVRGEQYDWLPTDLMGKCREQRTNMPAQDTPQEWVDMYTNQQVEWLVTMNARLIKERDQYAKLRQVSAGISEKWRDQYNELRDAVALVACNPPNSLYFADVMRTLLGNPGAFLKGKNDGNEGQEQTKQGRSRGYSIGCTGEGDPPDGHGDGDRGSQDHREEGTGGATGGGGAVNGSGVPGAESRGDGSPQTGGEKKPRTEKIDDSSD